jgi:hypothetical protein
LQKFQNTHTMKATASDVGIKYASPSKTLSMETLPLHFPRDTVSVKPHQPAGKVCIARRNQNQ